MAAANKEDGWLSEIVALTATHMLKWSAGKRGLFDRKNGQPVKDYLEAVRESFILRKDMEAALRKSGECWHEEGRCMGEALKEGDAKEDVSGGEACMQEQCFFHLVRSLRLSHDKMLCLLWSLAPYIDSRMAAAYAFLHEGGRGWLSTELAREVYQANYPGQNQTIRDLFLQETCFLLWERIPERSFSHELRIREQALRLLLSGDWMGWKEISGLEVTEPWRWEENPVGENALEQIFLHCSAPCICVYGREGIGKRFAVSWLGWKMNRALLWIDYQSYRNENDNLIPILFEACVTGSIVCVSARPDRESSEDFGAFQLWLRKLTEAVGRVLWICDSEQMPDMTGLQLICYPVSFPVPGLNLQRNYWKAFLKGLPAEREAELLEFAGRFDFTPKQMKGAVRQAGFEAQRHGGIVSKEDFRRGCILQLNHQLEQRARKVTLRYRMEELVLPPAQKELLGELCNQIRFRRRVYGDWGFEDMLAYGKGVSAVFSGPPGTGKTMAAQIIAGELGLELYQINLAAVVSKYVGETERNLEEIFREAKRSQGILFFDEADVLFSKRTEIKDSNDKYSNMEAAFMLQKMEEYSGMVILATNFQKNMDEAFKRRISFLIDFPFPGKTYRREIWQKVFPEKLPLKEDIDLDYLAEQFELSGSNIKNAAVGAAFLAASEDCEVAMKHLLKSILRELEKSGRKVTREELGIYRNMT